MSIGARIKSERERLGYTQEAFAGLGGAAKQSQIAWEQDRTKPNAGVLAAWSDVGADVLYIVTGHRSAGVDMTLLGMCEAALHAVFVQQHPNSRVDEPIRLSALTKVYNALQPRLKADADPAQAVNEAAAEYIAWIDDPSDPSMLERALFRTRGSKHQGISADRGSIASGGDVNIGSKSGRRGK